MKQIKIIVAVLAHLLLFAMLSSPFGLAITWGSFAIAGDVKRLFRHDGVVPETEMPFLILYSIISLAAFIGTYLSRNYLRTAGLFIVLLFCYYPLMWLLCTDVLEFKASIEQSYIPFSFFFLTYWLVLLLKYFCNKPVIKSED